MGSQQKAHSLAQVFTPTNAQIIHPSTSIEGKAHSLAQVFTPTNAQNIHPSTSIEGWSIACAALERELYSSP